MPFIFEPDDITEDVQLLTERDLHSRYRSKTVGRGENSLPRSVEADEIIDLTFDSSSTTGYTLDEGEIYLDSFRNHRQCLRAGDCVKLRDDATFANYHVALVMIKLITKDRDGQISVRGLPLIRNRDVLGKLPKKSSELCRVLQFDNGSPTPALLSVDSEAIANKCNVVFANTLWPDHCNNSQMVCRWDFKIFTVSKGRTSKPVEEVLERISLHDAQHQYRQSDAVLCQAWRGGRIAGGSWRDGANTLPAMTIETGAKRPASTTHRQAGQKYTVFDSFAGAGGVSRGAQMAGMKVTHAVDKAPDTWGTYRINFRDVKLFRCAVDEFILQAKRDHIRVDILHLSPPCQYFSPAKTHRSDQDDENIFALFSCNALINKVRPRLITVEQTFGLKYDRHQEYLNTLINDFTQFGYSVRWKIVRLCTWGSSQDRKRLIMIAAAPGEKLPPFPDPTHSESGTGGTKRFMTVRKALSGIRRGDDLHNLDTVRCYHPREAPYDPDSLTRTITTGGSDAIYFDGSRSFTLRELASLQGFPRYHRFKGTRTSIKRQIGNAFPPNTVRVLYRHLQKWLLEQDRILPHQGPDAITVDPADSLDDEAIIIDDSAETSAHAASGLPLRELIDISDDEMDIDSEGYGGRAAGAREPDDCIMIDLT